MSDLPTKPGPYYWREKDGDAWEHVIVMDPGNGHLYGRSLRPNGVLTASLHDWEQDCGAVGQWLSIPTAEELVELRSIKKMVDEGHESWGVYHPTGQLVLTGDKSNCEQQVEYMNDTDIFAVNQKYTCEPVTIIRKEKR